MADCGYDQDAAITTPLFGVSTMNQREIVLCNSVRTAIGTYDGSLKAVPAAELGATVVRAVLTRSKLKGSDVDTLVMGNVVQAGNKMNPARQSAAAKETAMKALVYHGPGKKALEDRPKPDIAAPTDAIVKIVKTTICGTDLHILKGDVPTCAPGRILGHEGVGVVDKVGAASPRFKSAIA